MAEIDLVRHRPERIFDRLRSIGHIDHAKDNFGLGNLPEGPLDAQSFDFVRGLPDAGRVDETEEDTVNHAGLLDGIARGAGDVGHDGAVIPQKRIQKRTFSAVGCAHDRYGHAVADSISQAERVCQLPAMGAGGVQQGTQARTVCKFDIFFAEMLLCVVALEVLEDESGAGLAAEFIGFLGERKGGLCVGLLGLDADAPASVGRFYNVAPIEGEDVADT